MFGCTKDNKFIFLLTINHAVTQLADALHHRQEGSGFTPDGVAGNFN
jgi:hypothetical protein